MNATSIERWSPLSFHSTPQQVEVRNHWRIAMAYPHEGKGPYLVDLSHCAKWDFQSSDLEQVVPWGISIPAKPGESHFEKSTLMSRMNATQAMGWRLDGQKADADVAHHIATDVTDATMLLALVGRHLFNICEKVTALDLYRPSTIPPFLIQGPVGHVPCQVVSFVNHHSSHGALLISCSRGYAQDMVQALMDAGREYGLRPAGEPAWTRWKNQFMTEEDV